MPILTPCTLLGDVVPRDRALGVRVCASVCRAQERAQGEQMLQLKDGGQGSEALDVKLVGVPLGHMWRFVGAPSKGAQEVPTSLSNFSLEEVAVHAGPGRLCAVAAEAVRVGSKQDQILFSKVTECQGGGGGIKGAVVCFLLCFTEGFVG